MEVRPATERDLEALTAIQREVQDLHLEALPGIYRDPSDEELRTAMRRALVDERTTIWLALENEVPLGFGLVKLEDVAESPFRRSMRIANIDQFAVRRSAHRRGVGKRLLVAIRDFAVRESCTLVRLDVLDFNVNAKAFYLSQGFEVFRQRMVLRLDEGPE